MHSFHYTELGSAFDMFKAAELTERGEMRKKYFRHALDETRHSHLFKKRVVEMGGASGAAGLHGGGTSNMHDVVEGQTLFERLGELEFLAFVYIAEAEAVEQFKVYQDYRLMDDKTEAMMEDILQDEYFHVSYSRAALEQYRKNGREEEVKKAMKRVKRRRLGERWLIFANTIGDTVTFVMLTVLYTLLVGPGRLIARLEKGGWTQPRPDSRQLQQVARSQG
jgi:hypothetical protein